MTYATPECILYLWARDAMMASAETDPPPSGGGEDGDDFPVGGLPGSLIPDWQPTFPPNGTGGAHRLW